MQSKPKIFSNFKRQIQQNAIAIMSLFIALVGLSLNVSYMEQKERNSNLRTARFQLLLELSELEKVTFQLQYDGQSDEYNARTGWVKVRLIKGLANLTNDEIMSDAEQLFKNWQQKWDGIGEKNTHAFDEVTAKITALRISIIKLIASLN